MRQQPAHGVEGLIGMMMATMGEEAEKDRCATAIVDVATMVGAVVMARAAGANPESK